MQVSSQRIIVVIVNFDSMPNSSAGECSRNDAALMHHLVHCFIVRIENRVAEVATVLLEYEMREILDPYRIRSNVESQAGTAKYLGQPILCGPIRDLTGDVGAHSETN